MHIVIVSASLEAGGAERVISQLVNEWAKKNVKCELILLDQKKHFYQISDSVKIHEIGKLHSNHYVDKINKYAEVRTIIKKIKPDVVLSFPEEIAIYVIGAMIGVKIPIVVSERNNPWVMPYNKVTRILRKVLYPFADGFIFQTNKVAAFFSSNIQKKAVVLSNPLDSSRIPAPYIGEREKMIVSIGRLEKQKNYKLLIEAFSIFQKKYSDYKLIVYGEGKQRKVLEEYADIKLKNGSWEFPGKDTDVLKKIFNAACFVLSSDYEGVPNALIEALACGIPSVSTDCEPGGAAELIENGVNGFIVPIGDAKAIANKISEIIENNELSQKFSIESVKIKEKLNAVVVSDRWLCYLKKVVEDMEK